MSSRAVRGQKEWLLAAIDCRGRAPLAPVCAASLLTAAPDRCRGKSNLLSFVEQGKGTAGKLLTDTTLADEAQKLPARANEAMSELQGVMTNLNATVKNVKNGTARLPEITEAMATEAKDLPGLVKQTQTSMREVERLVDALQRHWLLRKYVNKTNPPPRRQVPEVEEQARKNFKPLRSPKDSR